MRKLETFVINLLAAIRSIAQILKRVEKDAEKGADAKEWLDNGLGVRNYFIGDNFLKLALDSSRYIEDGNIVFEGRTAPGTQVTDNDVFKENTSYIVSCIVDDVSATNPRLSVSYTDDTSVNLTRYTDGRPYITDPTKTIRRVGVSYGGAGVYRLINPIIVEGNVPIHYTPAPEDLITDWDVEDEDAFNYLKNKPTKLSDFNNDLDVYLKSQTYSRTEANNQFVRQSGVQTIDDTKTFSSSPVIPKGTINSHAVNLEQLNENKPTIGDNGNWLIGGVDTGINASGNKGDKGEKGDDGADGLIPYIGNNGNWWIGDEDMGIPARGEKGEKGDTATSTDTLDDVATRGNVSSKPLAVSIQNRRVEHTESSIEYFRDDEKVASINHTNDDNGNPLLSFTRGGYLRFRLREETAQQAGGYFLTRVAGKDAENPSEFVTLRQLKSYDAEVVDTPVYSIVSSDLLIITKDGTSIELPAFTKSNPEDEGKRIKIVAHYACTLNSPFTDLQGNSKNTYIDAGRSVELVFLNGEWYEV